MMTNSKSAFIIGSYVAGCIATVGHMPAIGETLEADQFLLQPGGKGFNLLVGIYRLGAAVDGILPVGDDLWGRMAPLLFDELALPVSWLFPFRGPSGGALGLVDGRGDNVIAIASGANALLSNGHIHNVADRLGNASLVAAQCEVLDAPIMAAFTIARSVGALTLLNPSPYRESILELLPLTDVLVVNEAEAHQLANSLGMAFDTIDEAVLGAIAHQVHLIGVKQCIVTLGGKGAFLFSVGETPLFQAAFSVDTIDTIGAGDAFTAGYIAAYLNGDPSPLALRQAAACGAFVCQGRGVIDNLPGPSDVGEMLRRDFCSI